jgi:hypothetical protein
MTITMTENEAMFKHIRRMPVGQLKAMPDENYRKYGKCWSRKSGKIARAQQWIDGIIKLKTIEREKGGNLHRSDNAIDGAITPSQIVIPIKPPDAQEVKARLATKSAPCPAAPAACMEACARW